VFLVATSAPAEDQMVFRDPKTPLEQRVEDILHRLTLEEKIQLCHGRVGEGRAENFESGGVPRLNIAPLQALDGPVGVRTFDKTPTTALPSTLALSCTWDLEAAQAYGRLIAEEMLALHRHVLFGPGLNLMRSPLGGRNFEYLGEDPFLCGSIASSYIRSIQENGVAACAKHLVANDYEPHRHFTSSNMDERTLRELHLLPFEMAIRDGHVWSIMAANSLVNGIHVAENRRIQQEIVKDEFGFDGVMLSDWRAAYNGVPCALAGTDSTMGLCAYVFGDGKLLEAVKAGQVPESLVDDKARRLLRLYVRTGVLDPASRSQGALDSAEHQALARRLAAEGMVLLKNDRGLLPLDPANVRSLLIFGPGADVVPCGRGSGAVQSALHVTPLQGLTTALGQQVKITRLPWPESALPKSRRGKAQEAATLPQSGLDLEGLQRAARSADLVLFFATDPVHGEDTELDSFDLPDGQADAISALAAANPKLAVVLLTGEPLSLEPWAEKVPAILEAWYAGQSTGDAIADVLTGKVSPSGKLSCTFGKKLEDYACHALKLWPPRLITDKAPGSAGLTPRDRKATYAYAADYKEGVMLGYRWFDEQQIEPRFAFGHGLSYTTFALSHLVVDSTCDLIRVACTVKNTGSREGAEVVQVYISHPNSSVPRPPRELRGFARVSLAPGESRKVELSLRSTALAFYDESLKKWRAEAGDYQVQVGTSSRDLPLKAPVKLTTDRQYNQF
jgi:beta-glucosidase